MSPVDGGNATVTQLVATLDEALAVAAEYTDGSVQALMGTETPGSLLEQCLALCRSDISPVEPVRTLHQMACTGGTLFSKCVAAMPNVQLLSEVDPLSRAQLVPARPRFCPTDIIMLLRQSTRGASDEFIIRLFRHALDSIHAETTRNGQRLVLRDHAHSQYFVDASGTRRPTVRDIVAGRLPTRSLVFVRHPLDSFLSVKANGWFAGGIDIYCGRYLEFLDDYDGIPVLRYEDFLGDPESRMRDACELLGLPYSPNFRYTFDAHRLSGDSGRGGGDIAPRPRRTAQASALGDELEASTHYALLLQRLDYTP